MEKNGHLFVGVTLLKVSSLSVPGKYFNLPFCISDTVFYSPIYISLCNFRVLGRSYKYQSSRI
jgi:hypothetical protein